MMRFTFLRYWGQEKYFICHIYSLQGDSLGNVKPAYIKKLALELIGRFPDKFTDDFEENKVLVEKLTTISTKNMRNRIAGYIARIMEDRKSKNET